MSKVEFWKHIKTPKRVKVEFYSRTPPKEDDEMYCPKHPEQKLTKLRLDVYGCPLCEKEWLIHRLSEPFHQSNEVKP